MGTCTCSISQVAILGYKYWHIAFKSRGEVEDTTFETKDSEKVLSQGQGPSFRGQVASKPRTKML